MTDRPRPVPFPEHTPRSGPDHFAEYDALKMQKTTAKYRPSFVPVRDATAAKKAADKETAKAVSGGAANKLWHATKARMSVPCADCGKPRVMFCMQKLTQPEKDLAQSKLDEIVYTCGAEDIFGEGHALAGKLFVKQALVCGMPVEKAYQTCKLFGPCCSWCGEARDDKLVDLESLSLEKKAYPICHSCHASGCEVVTYGKADKTGGKGRKKKGAKRAKEKGGGERGGTGAAGADEEDEDDEEEGEQHEAEEDEGEGAGEEDDEEQLEEEQARSPQRTWELCELASPARWWPPCHLSFLTRFFGSTRSNGSSATRRLHGGLPPANLGSRATRLRLLRAGGGLRRSSATDARAGLEPHERGGRAARVPRHARGDAQARRVSACSRAATTERPAATRTPT